METIVDRLAAAAGHYEGSGDGLESGPFTAAFEVGAVLDGMGVTIDYVATGSDGAVVHREHTVLAFDMWSGEATLHVLCPELRGMGRLVQIGESTFDNGRGTDGFQLQIELDIQEGAIDYVWSWGAPGEELAERTRVRLVRVGPEPEAVS